MIYNSRYINYLILYYIDIKKTYMTYKRVDTHTHARTHARTHLFTYLFINIF